jgi:hypothetical protein
VKSILGLKSGIHLPQLVVCGDQSVANSTVLEALIETPFQRVDDMCVYK